MPKPKAPRWLTEAFRDGVDEAYVPNGRVIIRPAYPGAMPGCWLAHYDPTQHLCSGPLERFHFIPRQRVENALGALLPDGDEDCPYCEGIGELYRGINDRDWHTIWALPRGTYYKESRGCEDCERTGKRRIWNRDATLLVAWDPRNGALGCEHHHRRFDGHATSPRAPKIVVPHQAVPRHVHDFVADYGLETTANERFPGA